MGVLGGSLVGSHADADRRDFVKLMLRPECYMKLALFFEPKENNTEGVSA